MCCCRLASFTLTQYVWNRCHFSRCIRELYPTAHHRSVMLLRIHNIVAPPSVFAVKLREQSERRRRIGRRRRK
jgi:hypothetical protein